MSNIQKLISDKEDEYLSYCIDVCDEFYILDRQRYLLSINDYNEIKKILKNKFKLILNDVYLKYENFIYNYISLNYSYSYDTLLKYEKDYYLKYLMEKKGFNIKTNMSNYLISLIQPFLIEMLNLLLYNIDDLINNYKISYNNIYNDINYYILDYLKFRHNENYKLYKKNNY